MTLRLSKWKKPQLFDNWKTTSTCTLKTTFKHIDKVIKSIKFYFILLSIKSIKLSYKNDILQRKPKKNWGEAWATTTFGQVRAKKGYWKVAARNKIFERVKEFQEANEKITEVIRVCDYTIDKSNEDNEELRDRIMVKTMFYDSFRDEMHEKFG